jgi:hypothetical protein
MFSTVPPFLNVLKFLFCSFPSSPEIGYCIYAITERSASYLDPHIEVDSEGRLRMKLHDKRDDFKIPIMNFPFICSNIPAAPSCEVYIYQLIRYSRYCGSYHNFLDRVLLLTRKLQGNHQNLELFSVNHIQCNLLS